MRRRALLAALAVAAVGCSRADPPPNVALIVLDTVRADRLSLYGYARDTSPRLAAWGERGIRFEHASSTSGWTLPAHASLFTGAYAIEHGATQEHVRLDGALATLAERLAAAGYQTFGASGNPFVSGVTGLDRGFQAFDENWRASRAPGSAPGVRHPNLVSVSGFLDRRSPDRPFFLFVNFIEAHTPYNPPQPYRFRFVRPEDRPLVKRALMRRLQDYYVRPEAISARERQVTRDLYDGGLRYVDALAGELLDELEDRGLLENTLVVVTSDHGENLGEHGHFAHAFSLHRTSVRIPLLLLLPRGERAGEVVDAPVGLLDVHATILAHAGIVPEGGAGRDLTGKLDADAPMFAEYYYPRRTRDGLPENAAAADGPLARYFRRQRSVEEGGFRLIWGSDGRHELFRVDVDPLEEKNLIGRAPVADAERRLRALLTDFVERAGGPPPWPAPEERPALEEVDAETAERLRELGYLP